VHPPVVPDVQYRELDVQFGVILRELSFDLDPQ
jgi:hypothetical protein